MAKRGYDVFMYDHTIEGLPEENERFHWRKKGIACDDKYNPDLETLEKFMYDNGHSKKRGMILKMDVEGDEWGCFQMTPSDVLDRFDQIALELHGCIQFYKEERIIDVLRKINLTHQCIHVHLNNYSSHIVMNSIPYADSFEVTFANRRKYSFEKCSHTLPHELDQPCDPLLQELILGDSYLA